MTEPLEADSRYLHGSEPSEQARLSLLNRVLNDRCLAEIDLRGGERILDVASGLGQLTRAMARAAGPAGKVIAVERDARQLEKARALAAEDGEEPLVDFRHGDALRLPLGEDEWGSFDVVHSRFLVEHLRRPELAVEAMVRAARPGGRIVLMDDQHDLMRLWPPPDHFEELWAAYMESFGRLGNDPQVGRRLVALLHGAGATPSRNAQISYNSCAGAGDFGAVCENLVRVVDGARRTVVEMGLMSEARFSEAIDALSAWSRRPDAAVWYGMCWAEGIRPRTEAA